MKWYDRLSDDVYRRLCCCRTVKADLPELVNARWADYKERGKDKEGFTKEDALVAVLELVDENSVNIDLTIEEYNDLI